MTNYKCTVAGIITPAVVCGLIDEEGKCTSKIQCVYQKTIQKSQPATANFPTGSMGEEIK